MIRKTTLLIALLSGPFIGAFAQADLPEMRLDSKELEADMRFLASDQLMGRRTGPPGNNTAALYIASRLEAYGFQTVPGAKGYYQEVPFEAVKPPQSGALTIGKSDYTFGDNFLILSGNAADLQTSGVYAGYGWVDETTGHDDYKDLDVKGKVVFVISGIPDNQDPIATFKSFRTKRKLASERGAAGLIELYRLTFPWRFFRNYFGKESLVLANTDGDSGDDNLVYGWIQEKDKTDLENIQTDKKTKIHLQSGGFSRRPVQSQNVIGVLPGTDPVLKDEYVVLTAHYDHVGTGRDGGGMFTPQDSIFNGARDNAFGTVSLLAAAKAYSQAPTKRSVVILAVTGEEIGLLGSQYYAEHPLIPLEKTIFNLNTDGAGYNDTGAVSIIGYGRTGTNDQLKKATDAFGLRIIADPAPEQGLFDRSDNVSFAVKGVPAVCFSPGLTEFDQEIAKYYHQVTDGPETIDYPYLAKFCQSLTLMGRLVADMDGKPTWVAGDKYEEAGKKLYGR